MSQGLPACSSAAPESQNGWGPSIIGSMGIIDALSTAQKVRLNIRSITCAAPMLLEHVVSPLVRGVESVPAKVCD